MFQPGNNRVKCVIDSAAITSARCSSASRVAFRYKGRSDDVCSHAYPPATCSALNSQGSEKCRCTKKVGNIYTYELIVFMNNNRVGENLSCTVCVSPTNPFVPKVSPSCHFLNYSEYSYYVCFGVSRYKDRLPPLLTMSVNQHIQEGNT